MRGSVAFRDRRWQRLMTALHAVNAAHFVDFFCSRVFFAPFSFPHWLDALRLNRHRQYTARVNCATKEGTNGEQRGGQRQGTSARSMCKVQEKRQNKTKKTARTHMMNNKLLLISKMRACERPQLLPSLSAACVWVFVCSLLTTSHGIFHGCHIANDQQLCRSEKTLSNGQKVAVVRFHLGLAGQNRGHGRFGCVPVPIFGKQTEQ